MTPLAAMLDPPAKPDDACTKGQEAEVAGAAAPPEPNAVICCQREDIPAIVDALILGKIPQGCRWRRSTDG